MTETLEGTLAERAFLMFEKQIRAWLDETHGANARWRSWSPKTAEHSAMVQELRRRSLVEIRGPRIRPTDLAVEVWQGRADLREILGLDPLPATGPSMPVDPHQARLDAKAYFQENVLAPYLANGRDPYAARLRNYMGMPAPVRGNHALLLRVGLLKMDKGSPIISELGERVALDEVDLDEVLGLKPPKPQQPPPPSIAVYNHGNIGALSTGAGGSAVGSVTVQAVDQAMHQLVDLQDDLGRTTDGLFEILRRLREAELKVEKLETLREVVEDLEINAFLDRVGVKRRERVLKLLELAVPGIKLLLKLTGPSPDL
jgi:hypothetical protein